MQKVRLLLVGLIALVGCDSLRTAKVDNPVARPAPPRMPQQQLAEANDGTTTVNLSQPLDEPLAADPIQQTAASSGATRNIADDDVVATVYGQPIFAYEITEFYRMQLAEMEKQASPEDIRRVREMLIKRDLKAHIENRMLVHAFKSGLKKEQLESLDKQIELMFDKNEVPRLQQAFNVSTKYEVEMKLREYNSSLELRRELWGSQHLAMEYLKSKSESKQEIDRAAALAYYEAHADEFAIPASVKWQQIMVDINKRGGKEKAAAIVDQIVDELNRGADFAEVAKRLSDGPTAAQGGEWDWTKRGSLAETVVETALFEQPVGAISDSVLEGKSSYHIVKVLTRKDAGVVPFADVQDGIKQKLEKQVRQESTKAVLDELYQNAVIETVFDEKPKQKT